jgi:hypothetical protein
MEIMTTETNRSEFEQWAKDKYNLNPAHERYDEEATNWVWEAWQAAQPKWLPIETAPKDGTQILSFAEWEGITVSSWLDCSEVWETTEKMGWAKNYDTVEMSYETFEPTHWMPLHNPPTSESMNDKYKEPHGSKQRVEEQIRIALDGHPDSQLWGENGLLAATMRCVYGYEKLERERDEARKALFEISEMDYDEGNIWDQAEKIQAIAHNAYYHPPTSEKI